jgi:hypothetical protein
MRRMSIEVGTAAHASPITSAVIGSVASIGDGASDSPMMPPASTTSGPAEAARACAAPESSRFATMALPVASVIKGE